MSKSTGNVINPHELLQKFGSDAVRCYFLAEGPQQKDVSFEEKDLVFSYNSRIIDSYCKINVANVHSESLSQSLQQEVHKA